MKKAGLRGQEGGEGFEEEAEGGKGGMRRGKRKGGQ